MFKLIKWTAVGAAGLILAGGLFLGTDAFSYARTAFSTVRGRVKSTVPVELELKRARDYLDQILPEIRTHVVLVAREEVEVDELEKEVARERSRLTAARRNLNRVKDELRIEPCGMASDGARGQRVASLAANFERLKLAEQLMEGKERVLDVRRRSLHSAVQSLRDAQVRKLELEAEIERLEHEATLMKLTRQSPQITVGAGSLVKAEKLVAEIRTRLVVAQKVLVNGLDMEHGPVEPVSERELLAQIDTYLGQTAELARVPGPAVE